MSRSNTKGHSRYSKKDERWEKKKDREEKNFTSLYKSEWSHLKKINKTNMVTLATSTKYCTVDSNLCNKVK